MQMGVMSRAFVRELGGHRNFQKCLPRPQSCSFSTVAQDAGVQKKGRGGIGGIAAVTAAVAIVGGSYYAMNREPLPRPYPPVPVQTQAPPTSFTEPKTPFAPLETSARDELTQRMDNLKSDLEALRKQKRDKLGDLKKKEIKQEIHIIQSGIAALDKR